MTVAICKEPFSRVNDNSIRNRLDMHNQLTEYSFLLTFDYYLLFIIKFPLRSKKNFWAYLKVRYSIHANYENELTSFSVESIS